MKSITGVGFAVLILTTSIFHEVAWGRDLLNSDLLLSPRWYVIREDTQNTANEMQFRAYAGQFDNSNGQVGGLVNLLTFTCSKSGHYFNFSFPDDLKITALDGLKRNEAVRITIADYDLKELASINGRRSGDNSVYFDLANNDDSIFSLPAKMSNNLLIFRSRRGETAINVVSEDGFAGNVEEGLRSESYTIEKSYADFNKTLVDCSSFVGVNIVE